RAITDFERSLDLEESSRVRVALAEAATFDPSDPMRPVQELQAVLEADPNNLDANFIIGTLRQQIGRVDSARAAFERVVALAPADAPIRGRAEEALAVLDAAP
ncbi:tetratricopeptide repeat protein, partial [Rubrivirga sp.]|uniref:tetratricopeptide repeat protein n=1 Tax=Rubrivirga sp. TaxID=1885344 RepID=UPI003C7085D7